MEGLPLGSVLNEGLSVLVGTLVTDGWLDGLGDALSSVLGTELWRMLGMVVGIFVVDGIIDCCDAETDSTDTTS